MKIKLNAIMIDCRKPLELAQFYAKLLDWVVVFSNEEYAGTAPQGVQYGEYPGISFQYNPDYVPPVWPAEEGKQQTMEHLDFVVDDLDTTVAHAIQCGAKKADVQFSPEEWIVMLDPEGHPFCLCLNKWLMDQPHFALK